MWAAGTENWLCVPRLLPSSILAWHKPLEPGRDPAGRERTPAEWGLEIKMKFMHAWVNGAKVIPIVRMLLRNVPPPTYQVHILTQTHTHTVSLTHTQTHTLSLTHTLIHTHTHTHGLPGSRLLTCSPFKPHSFRMTSFRNPFLADPTPYSHTTRLGGPAVICLLLHHLQ